MLESVFIIGIVLIFLYFIIYALYSQNIKDENTFAKDVFYYLVRRYPDTKIIDYGGLSSDPIIESHKAGPFKSLEIKVITNKQEGVTDRDLILRGVIDRAKFRQSSNDRLNLLVSPQITWNDPKTRVKLGVPLFDQRFKISAENSVFVRNLFLETELGEMLRRNYDIEAYSLYWYQDGTTVIQIRMESMTPNSFLNAYNMALASVGLLNQKGYLLKSDETQGDSRDFTVSWSPASSPVTHTLKDTYTSKYQAEEALYKLTRLPKIKLHPERDLKKLEEKKIHQEKMESASPPKMEVSTDQLGSISPQNAKYIVQKTTESNLLIPLFTSIRYQAKNINYEENTVEIETFSSQLPLLRVTFPSSDQALLKGNSIQIPKHQFSLQIDNPHNSRPPSWDNPWKNIEITGTQYIQDQIKHRTVVANQISEAGNLNVKVKGSEKGIEYSILGTRSKEGITISYSLLLDLVWFFEMLV
ncbi:hypothetical protein CEE45_07150 [Candidatus Heimdallarchaeota archaeon B3_Heim]|nr:MAG: hypothetical protein CEE45_07150 [Candidatus Heimdallarchaeota archaeon B3_Heim]